MEGGKNSARRWMHETDSFYRHHFPLVISSFVFRKDKWFGAVWEALPQDGDSDARNWQRDSATAGDALGRGRRGTQKRMSI